MLPSTRTITGLAALAAASLTLAGCETHRYAVATVDRDAVAELEYHQHSASCGHAWDGNTWVFVGRAHAHSPECGHYYFNERWWLNDPLSYEPGRTGPHVHTSSCGHLLTDAGWIVLSDHQHFDGCGHYFIEDTGWCDGSIVSISYYPSYRRRYYHRNYYDYCGPSFGFGFRYYGRFGRFRYKRCR